MQPSSAGVRSPVEKDPVLIWGTYDLAKPRVRLLLDGLRCNQVPFYEIHTDIWAGVRDKGTLTRVQQMRMAARWMAAIPRLVVRYARAPRHSSVLIPYLGLFDILALAPLAWCRRKQMVWDIFISPYDTVVNDRRLVGRYHPASLALYMIEWIASRLVHRPFLDTQAHASRVEALLGLPAGAIGVVPLGTDPARFPPRTGQPTLHDPLRAFFYGQYIPLHGLETVVRAAQQLESEGIPVRWQLAGTGQEQHRITVLAASLGVTTVEQLGWVPAADLPHYIQEADVGLGIFGTSAKALTVVPNKVFELSATQTPIITADSPAMREFAQGHPWIRLVEPGSPESLVAAIKDIVARRHWPSAPLMPTIGPAEVGKALLQTIAELA